MYFSQSLGLELEQAPRLRLRLMQIQMPRSAKDILKIEAWEKAHDLDTYFNKFKKHTPSQDVKNKTNYWAMVT
jgi:hypothetical protein